MADLFDNSLIQSPPGATNRREQDSSASLSPLAVSETFPGGLSIKKDANMNGWVKLHRQFLDWEWYSEPNTKNVFIHLLLTANYEDKEWRGIIIQRGQNITGLHSLSATLHLSIQTIRTCLSRLKSTNEITIKSTSRFSIITVCNYDKYQNNLDECNKPSTNEQQTTNKPSTTPKEREEYKEKYIYNVFFDEQLKANENENQELLSKYKQFIAFLFGKTEIHPAPLTNVLSLTNQCTFKEYVSLLKWIQDNNVNIKVSAILLDMENKPNLKKQYSNVALTIRGWMRFQKSNSKKSAK